MKQRIQRRKKEQGEQKGQCEPNRSKAREVVLTLTCTVIILGIGYTGIVKIGKMILHNESAPKVAEYGNTSSNIFYGKIEDDIELYPWNYYSDAVPAKGYPDQISSEGENKEEVEYLFRELIAECSGVPYYAVEEYYQQHLITDRLLWVENAEGKFYFYQEIIELEEKSYQVRIACTVWGYWSVACSEYRAGDMKDTPEWRAGKDALTNVLEKENEGIAELAYQLWRVCGGMYAGNGAEYLEWYNMILDSLNQYMGQNPETESQRKGQENIQSAGSSESGWGEDNKEYKRIIDVELYGEVDGDGYAILGDYSCQIIERSDLILLLIQGDITMGIYYDPIRQRFCGYNLF